MTARLIPRLGNPMSPQQAENPDAAFILSATGRTATLAFLLAPALSLSLLPGWAAPAGEKTEHPRSFGSRVIDVPRRLAFSPDGKLLACAVEGAVKLYDPKTLKLTVTLRGDSDLVTAFAFSPDGQVIASCDRGGGVALWDLRKRKVVADFDAHDHSIKSIAFSPDGKRLATGSGDRTGRLWDARTRKCLATLRGVPGSEFMAVAFSPDGKTLATAGTMDWRVLLWDGRTGKYQGALERENPDSESGLHSLAFSPDGKLLVSGGYDGSIWLWDVKRGKKVAALVGHEELVYSLAFSPDGKLLASGGYDKAVRLWDVKTGKAVCALTDHKDIVLTVAFSPDGKLLASGGQDRTLILWKMPPRK